MPANRLSPIHAASVRLSAMSNSASPEPYAEVDYADDMVTDSDEERASAARRASRPDLIALAEWASALAEFTELAGGDVCDGGNLGDVDGNAIGLPVVTSATEAGPVLVDRSTMTLPIHRKQRPSQKARERASEHQDGPYWRSVEEGLAAVEQSESDAVSAQIKYLDELIVINQAEMDAYCSDTAIRERAAACSTAAASSMSAADLRPAPPQRKRQRLFGEGA
jgi:hypothetical protein